LNDRDRRGGVDVVDVVDGLGDERAEEVAVPEDRVVSAQTDKAGRRDDGRGNVTRWRGAGDGRPVVAGGEGPAAVVAEMDDVDLVVDGGAVVRDDEALPGRVPGDVDGGAEAARTLADGDGGADTKN